LIGTGLQKRIPVDRDTGQIIDDTMEFRQYAPESNVKVDYGLTPMILPPIPAFSELTKVR